MSNSAKTYRIETESLVIRCYNPADAVLLKKSIDESLEHLRPWMPWVKWEPETLEDKIERVRRFRAMFDADEDYLFGIFNKEETELIGSTGLHTRIGPNAREIGYWINKNHVGKGYATEAVLALLKVGFEIEGVERIEIRCDPENVNSLKITSKLGFMHEATLARRLADADGNPRDVMIWSMFKDHYEQSTLKTVKIMAFDAINRVLI